MADHWTSRRIPMLLAANQSKLELICVYLFPIAITIRLGFFANFVPIIGILTTHHYGFHPYVKYFMPDYYIYEDVEVLSMIVKVIIDIGLSCITSHAFPTVGSFFSLLLVGSLISSIARQIHLNRRQMKHSAEERMKLTNFIKTFKEEGQLKSKSLDSVCKILHIGLDSDSEYLDNEEDLEVMKNHIHTFYSLLGWQVSNNPTRLIYRSSNCSICQMEESEDTVMCYGFFPCGHICVCRDCYDGVYDQQGGENAFCPVCQAPVYKLSKLENRDLVFFDESFFPATIDKDDRYVSLEEDGEGNSFILLQNKSL